MPVSTETFLTACFTTTFLYPTRSRSAMSLIVTGSVGIDTIETPDGQRRENVLGGSCAYFAAAASFYTKTAVSGVVGSDFPRAFREILEGFRVDLAGLEVREGKTFRWGGKYLGNMDSRETTFVELNVLGEEPAAIPEAQRSTEYIFLANASPKSQLAQLAHFPKRKLVVADTMDLWIEQEQEALLELIAKVDGLLLNYDEAEQLTGKRNTVAAAKELLTLGPRFVVVKKGEHGCLFAHEEGIGALPAYPAERVVDPTGAGDSFGGGMMGYLAAHEGDPARFDVLREALAHATIMASFTIEAFSLDRLQAVTREELEERLAEYKRMLRLA